MQGYSYLWLLPQLHVSPAAKNDPFVFQRVGCIFGPGEHGLVREEGLLLTSQMGSVIWGQGVSVVFPLYGGPWPAGKAGVWLQIPQASRLASHPEERGHTVHLFTCWVST